MNTKDAEVDLGFKSGYVVLDGCEVAILQGLVDVEMASCKDDERRVAYYRVLGFLKRKLERTDERMMEYAKYEAPQRASGGSKDKITEAGQPCRKCGTPVIRQEHRKPPKFKPGSYWFEYWFKCPNKKCRTLYMVETAKRMFDRRTA